MAMVSGVRKHRDGVYRITLSSIHFGQITCLKGSAGWHAEICETVTGNRLRHAGIWKTLREAVEECISIGERY
jgi:hypothetical protein